MLGSPFISGEFSRGMLIAEVGLFVVGAYYVLIWRNLRKSSETPVTLDALSRPEGHPWPELRHLQRGVLSSVFLFMLAGAADKENDWLFRLVGALMGFGTALCFAMFGVGFVALWNLWKELIRQLIRARIGLLLLSSPLAVLWLGLGLGVFVMFGMVVEKTEKLAPFGQFLLNGWLIGLVWLSIVTAFYSLWKGRSHAALMLRLILLVSFSAIIVGAVMFSYWWVIHQTTFLFVLFLSAIGALNIVFYSGRVRLTALKHNLLEPPDPV
jgi:hypothetical protein